MLEHYRSQVTADSLRVNSVLFDITTAQESVNHMTLLYILIITLAVSVPTLVILLFSSFFSKRVGTLKAAMHRARLGDYNIIDEVKGDDELTETFEDLKATVLMDLLTGREFL